MKQLQALALAVLVAASASASYHVELEATPGAAFPFFGKFGTVTLHVYPGGVRAETFWLNGFTRNGSPAITVENPLGRMYTDVPIREVSAIVRKLSGTFDDGGCVVAPPVRGKIGDLTATRYRLQYGPEAWIDLWTTAEIPDNPQLHAIVQEMVQAISPGTAAASRDIPGLPVYVELHFRRFRKVPILRLKKVTNEAEGEALTLGPLYMKAPLLDAIWK